MTANANAPAKSGRKDPAKISVSANPIAGSSTGSPSPGDHNKHDGAPEENGAPSSSDDADLMAMMERRFSGIPEAPDGQGEEIEGGEGSDSGAGSETQGAGAESETNEEGESHEEEVQGQEEEVLGGEGGKLAERVKELEAKAAEAATALEQAKVEQAKVAEEHAKLTSLVATAEVSPLFLEESPAALAKWEESARKFVKWAVENWDGVEADENGKGEYTAQQVRQRYNAVQEMLTHELPTAKTRMQERSVKEAEARKAYPQLFDAKSKEHGIVQGFLRLCPQVRQFPDYMLMLGDAMAGERMRLAEAAKAAAPAKSAGANGTKQPPKVAVANGAKPAAKAAGEPRKSGGAGDVERQFLAGGGSRSALVKAIMAAGI